jgi:beta-xylosidase
VDADLLDRAALRVLTQKAALGLLDPDWKPGRYQTAPTALPGVAETEPRFDSWRSQDIARRLAEESVVLLDNPEGLLPLAAPRSIAVIGPGADDAHCLFGCYPFPNHVLPHHPDLPLGIAAQTVLDAVRAEFPGSAVRHEPGCAISGRDRDGFAAAVEAAREAEWTVLVVGDRSGMFGHGTSGEGCDVATLESPGVQGELAEAVSAAARRTILVLVPGRP